MRWTWLWAVAACSGDGWAPDFPEVAPPALTGSGGPQRVFSPAELERPCGYVTGGPEDDEHHNLSVMYDGLLLHPWAPEWGGGGISFFDVADPCAPVLVGRGYSDRMRETHTLAFGGVDGREFLAVDYLSPDAAEVGGVGFWDITDRTAPVWVSELATPNFHYPDSYLHVTFSSFWLGPVLYLAAGGNGVHVIDVRDPLNPTLVTTIGADALQSVIGRVDVIGTRMFIQGAGTFAFFEYDVTDPFNPRPISNGSTFIEDDAGVWRAYYFSSIAGKYGLFARSKVAGGPIVYDLSVPGAPRWTSEVITEGGDGGYVYRQGDRIFQGDSNFGGWFDFSDPEAPSALSRITVEGDLDTISPIGNVAVVSVDSGAPAGQASAVFPWAEQPDRDPPSAELWSPQPLPSGVAAPGAIGVSFDEWIEPKSANNASFRVWSPTLQAVVHGRYYVQEAIVNFVPDEPLAPGHVYNVWLPAGGVADLSGNPLAEDVAWTFTTREAR